MEENNEDRENKFQTSVCKSILLAIALKNLSSFCLPPFYDYILSVPFQREESRGEISSGKKIENKG